jgi:hypothetical protein
LGLFVPRHDRSQVLPVTFDVRNIPGFVAVLMCCAFAVWLWRIGTRGSTARQLS